VRKLVYCGGVGALGVLTWFFPFLWELVVAAALGGIYWAFFAPVGDGRDDSGH
jgi:hypothetical protein